MNTIKIAPNENGGHDNDSIYYVTPGFYTLPEGWAIIPEELGTPETLENYPFGEITVEERDGIPTVTSWTPLPVPEPEFPPGPAPDPTTEERVSALEDAMLAMMMEA